MSNVDINILSRNFNIACPAEKYEVLKSAAAMLDDEVQALRHSRSPGVDFDKLIVTAALNFCARYERLAKEYEDTMHTIMETNNVLSSQLSTLPKAPDTSTFQALLGAETDSMRHTDERRFAEDTPEQSDQDALEAGIAGQSDTHVDDMPSFDDLDSINDQTLSGFGAEDEISFDEERDFSPADTDQRS